MTRRNVITVGLAALIFVTANVASGCGGGGSDNPVPTGLIASFTGPTASANSVTLQPGSATGANFNVRVTATDVTDFFGAAFTVTFPSSSVQFVSRDDTGSFLRDGGIAAGALEFDAKVTTAGEVQVVATRLNAGSYSGVNVVGSRELITLRFTTTAAVANGPVDIAATGREVRSSIQPPPEGQPINVTWAGGSVTATLN